MKIVRAAIDRIEEGWLVCIPDEGEGEYLLPAADYPAFRRYDVLDLSVSDGTVLSASLCEGEGERRLQQNQNRLRALFNRHKKD